MIKMAEQIKVKKAKLDQEKSFLKTFLHVSVHDLAFDNYYLSVADYDDDCI